jgi:hypothetical protein
MGNFWKRNAEKSTIYRREYIPYQPHKFSEKCGNSEFFHDENEHYGRFPKVQKQRHMHSVQGLCIKSTKKASPIHPDLPKYEQIARNLIAKNAV